MNWLTTSIIVIGVFIWCSRKSAPARKTKPLTPGKAKRISKEQIKALMDSHDVGKMAAALDHVKTPLDRHHLLSAMVQELYRQRDQPAVRKQLYDYGDTYVDEFSQFASALKAASDTGEMQVPVFKCLAIAMEEDQRYQDALEICRVAVEWDLDDGTKTGYAGRINRIKKKQAAQ
jgi:hypothetical protein